MTTKLTNLVITKVALVDEGSCSAAHIKLYKRKQEGGNEMNYEELKKKLTVDELAVVEAEITKAKGEAPAGFLSPDEQKKLEAAKEAAEASVTKLQGEVDTLKKSAEVSTQTDEDILKNSNVDPAIKAILERNIAKSKAAESVIKKMQDDADAIAFIAKAKEVSFIPEADTKVVALLKSVKGVDGASEAVMEILKSANTLLATGATFQEVGSNGTPTVGTNSDDAWQEIEKAAASLVAKGNVTKAKSIDMVIANQPDLYNKYVAALRNE